MYARKVTVHYKQNIDMMESSIEFLEIHPISGEQLSGFYIHSPLLGGWYRLPFKDHNNAEAFLRTLQNDFKSKHPLTGRLTGGWLELWNVSRKMGAVMFKPTFYISIAFLLIAAVAWAGYQVFQWFK